MANTQPTATRIATHRWTNRYQVILPEVPEHNISAYVAMFDATNPEAAIKKALAHRPLPAHLLQFKAPDVFNA